MCNINKNIENTAQVFIHSQIPHKDQSKDQSKDQKRNILSFRKDYLSTFLIEDTMEHYHTEENQDDARASSAGLHYHDAGKEKSWLHWYRSRSPARRDTCRSTRGPVVYSGGRRKCPREKT